LVEKGGSGREGRAKLLEFLRIGMQGNDPKYHGTPESWNEAARQVYRFDSVDILEEAWLQALRTPTARIAARDAGNGMKPSAPAASTSITTAGNRTELRSSGAPMMPVLEPPVKARAAAPDFEPTRPTYLPPGNPSSTPSSHPVSPATLDIPPPVLLPPEVPRPGGP
jgi:hypothetical protein